MLKKELIHREFHDDGDLETMNESGRSSQFGLNSELRVRPEANLYPCLSFKYLIV